MRDCPRMSGSAPNEAAALGSRKPTRARPSVSQPLRRRVRHLALVATLTLGLQCTRTEQRGASGPSTVGPQAASAPLPVGLRRLTNREFGKAASALLGVSLGPEFLATLPPDVRQEEGYARNFEQTMSGPLAVKLEQSIPALVERALTAPTSTFTCMQQREPTRCAHEWVATTVERAWRRPVSPPEHERLMALYERGRVALEPNGGARAVLTALLLSPELWHVSELGVGAEDAQTVHLAPSEIADQIAVVMRGTLADPPLLAAARAGRLEDPDVRREHARRLLAQSDTREHYREFVLGWLEVDQLAQTSKSAAVFERYEDFKPHLLAETERFTDVVFMSHGASVKQLLAAGFASVDPEMAVFYGLSAYGAEVPSRGVGRVGVLQHASFLASHSQSDTTSPVLRGDFVLRKVLCHRLPRPAELDIEVVMPRPRRDMTRREQFALHGADPRCADCHDQIDGFGLTFEVFDAAGRRRETELGKPVRSDGKVLFGGAEQRFADSEELVNWLISREETSECFARQLFRFVTGRSDPGAEAGFLALRDDLDDTIRDNVLEHLVAYVGSEQFVERRRH